MSRKLRVGALSSHLVPQVPQFFISSTLAVSRGNICFCTHLGAVVSPLHLRMDLVVDAGLQGC